MSLVPLQLSETRNVFLVGAGGGFDFLCGLPIALQLEEQGINVVIGNYSFTDLNKAKGVTKVRKNFLAVNADSFLEDGDYFPEKHLCSWYRSKRREDIAIYCFAQQGVEPLLENYNYICSEHDIDTVICVDGGVDGIFRGDETDLGTPSMDSISVIVTSLCKAARRYYCCTAFGTEGTESKVSHAQALNRMSDLIRLGAARGVGMLLANTQIGSLFMDASETIFSKMPPIKRSIVVSTILASIEGRFGPTTVTTKTQEKQPWISPLQGLYWFFEAEAVARMKLFYSRVLNSKTVVEVGESIAKERKKARVRAYESIPI